MRDARAELRQRLTDLLSGFTCAHDENMGCPPCQADRVLELFPDVVAERVRKVPGEPEVWFAPPADLHVRTTHTRFMLRTPPEPIREATDA
jgi:hypothetical protein